MPPGSEEGLPDAPFLELYLADLDAPPLPRGELLAALAPADEARIGRLRRPDDRQRREHAWGLLRLLLAGRTGTPAPELPIAFAPEGKPLLPGGPAFNLSHSGRHLLIGLLDEGRIGVDIEVIRKVRDLEGVARKYFAPPEIEELITLDPGERAEAFFRGWVRKEALLKATGRGLHAPLSSFAVSLAERSGDCLTAILGEGIPEGRWCICSIPAPAGTQAAVAWDRPELRPIEGKWPGA